MSREYLLRLADGTRLVLSSGDEQAAVSLDFFARTSRLSPFSDSDPLPSGAKRLRCFCRGKSDDHPTPFSPHDERISVLVLDPPEIKLSAEGRRPFLNRPPMTEEKRAWVRLARLAAGIGRETLSRGGVLIHGGLAQTPPASDGVHGMAGQTGLLLAGRSGVGKSTAARRLPPPWRSLCDDVTLIVRDPAGRYWAHPFPTWSRFFGEEAGDGSDTWDIQEAVPLRAMFVLEQGPDDRAERIGLGHTLALLSELAHQASNRFLTGVPVDEIAAFHKARYENLCALVRAVPAHMLHVSLRGMFWNEITRVMSG